MRTRTLPHAHRHDEPEHEGDAAVHDAAKRPALHASPLLYYIGLAGTTVFYVLLAYTCYSRSQSVYAKLPRLRSLLQRSKWQIPSLPLRDASDVQWEALRTVALQLFVIYFVWSILSRIFKLWLLAREARDTAAAAQLASVHVDGGAARPSSSRRHHSASQQHIQQQQHQRKPQLAAEALFDERAAADERVRATMLFYNVCGAALLVYAHGCDAIFCYLCVWLTFNVGKTMGTSRLTPAAVWITHAALLVAIYYYDGFDPRRVFKFVGDLIPYVDDMLIYWSKHRGVVGWGSYFKVSILRLISYSMDRYWAAREVERRERASVRARAERTLYGAAQRDGDDGDDGDERDMPPPPAPVPLAASWLRGTVAHDHWLRTYGRTLAERHLPRSDYANFLFVSAHCFYLPLLVAGPIVTFNSFVNQVRSARASLAYQPLRRTLAAFAYAAAIGLSLELLSHLVFYHAVSDSNLWRGGDVPSWELAIIGLFVLHWMWTKFTFVWRLAWTAALADGIVAADNMRRCVHNNFSFVGFWRGWHVSLNHWIVRYVYLPLGGRTWRHYNVWVIFAVIGLWHDIETRWLCWGLLNCLFFNVEVVLTGALARCRCVDALRRDRPNVFVLVRAFAQAISICGLVLANLGILYGFAGTPRYLSLVFVTGANAHRTLAGTLVFLVTANIAQHWLRAREEAERHRLEKSGSL